MSNQNSCRPAASADLSETRITSALADAQVREGTSALIKGSTTPRPPSPIGAETLPLKSMMRKPSGETKASPFSVEHTDKGDLRYAEICRWFALSVRVDGIRWYVDDPKIIARIRRVNEQHGYAQDVDVTYAPFPPGVVVRRWVRP